MEVEKTDNLEMREEGDDEVSKYTYEDGTECIGEWKNEGKREGIGYMKFPIGTVYVGHFENGFPSGLGVMRFADGARYEGEFLQGWFHGFGIFWRSDGMRFEGEFRGGKISGKGLITYADGTHGFPRQEGQFQDCKFIRKEQCQQSILKAQKYALLARSLI
ncbi:MORN repeat-containing protein 4 homolog [Centruroides sculpturatus]|uniref:MORN repeat-containing protein 4 homolog n=1 Tax=Centruroides sculpturatus TaxID=218467 RepID=UPI000C6D49F7|nr:MORN repeat-containing protein 4 homolog [Centruroides sculpturatus]